MRIYKEGTHLTRFFIELIIVLIALAILYLLSVVLLDHEFSWIEIITTMFMITIFAALGSYNDWWKKENHDR